MTERLTGDALAQAIAQLHPRVRANFVYLPDTHDATHDEIRAAFPIPPERIQRFYRAWYDALRKDADAQPVDAQSESEPA